MPATSLTPAIRDEIARLGRADIMVGIPSFKNAATIGYVVRAAQAGLVQYFPDLRPVLVNSDAGSPDGTQRVVVETELEVEAASIPPDSQLCRDLSAAHRAIYGTSPRLVISPGFNDPRFLIKRAGIPTVTYGPGILAQAHQPDEYLNIADLVKATQVLGLMTVRTLSSNAAQVG